MSVFKKNLLIGSIALMVIILYGILRFIFKLNESIYNAPSFIGLFLGTCVYFYDITLKLKKGEFSSDFLAGAAMVTALLLKQYLAGIIIVLMFASGNILEAYALRNASLMLKALASRMPKRAHRQKGSILTEVNAEEIQIEDVLSVFPHEICPVDGVVLEGYGTMDESYLTGEPFQISKAPGSNVISGAINGSTMLIIKATKLAQNSRYAEIAKVLRDSEKYKPKIRRIGDRLGSFYTPLALTVATMAWFLSGDVMRFLSVLVIATPCPLLISIPISVLGAISLASKRGIVIKNPATLEQIDKCKTAIFDKTGTLTCGWPQLDEILCAPGINKEEIFSLVASLEQYSKHPLALAVTESANKAGALLHQAKEVHENPGQGISGEVKGYKIKITGRNLLPQTEEFPFEKEGLECIVLRNGVYAALLRFRDMPRPEGAQFIAHLSPRHNLKRILIISGDRESEVRFLANKIGIKEIFYEKSPEEKLEIVKNETKAAKTLYVGDGINDAPALMAATVGIAIGRNSDITAEAAGAVILESSLTKVDELIHIGRKMRSIALQSAVGGMTLSLIGMAAAAFGFLSPVSGALLQEGIDLLSILNALRIILPPKQLIDFMPISLPVKKEQ